MMNRSRSRFLLINSILIVLLLISSLISLNLGAVSISPGDVLQTFLGNGSGKQELILFQFRLPAILLAIMVGGGMAAAGTILQSVTRNDLADPGILGINSGAGLAVVIYITFFQTATGGLSLVSTYILPLFAFLGALFAGALIMVLSWKKGLNSVRMILTGIGINAGLSSIIIALQLRLSPHDFVKAMVWLSGDLWATQWQYVWALFPWFVILVAITMLKSQTLNILNLGSPVAAALGIRTLRERIILLILAIALSGISVAAGGGIAFLGLIAPHIARRLVGPKHQMFLPTAVLAGTIILVLADTIGKNLLSPTEIPAGLVVSIVSVPYFLILLIRSK